MPTNPESNNNRLQPNQDPSSVYFIHPSDRTSQQLVSVKFNGTGFSDWKRCMLIALSAKNKLAFVNGALPKPALDDPNYNAWVRCNDMIISWILFNLDT